MELRDEVKSQFERSHKLAKKYYDSGKTAKARVEYLKCSGFLKHLAELSPPERRGKLLERSRKFKEIADGLQDGSVKVYTSGILPPEPKETKRERASDEEKTTERIKELVLVEKPKVRFKDIAGLDEVKERIKEAIVYPFTHPEEYKYFGVSPGGGILLYGPPGCGKTMLAAAAAAECDAVFINLKISDIKDKYVGESEKNIKQVFEVARTYDRAILFFDEIDAMAGERSSSQQGHERSLVNELLAQMDALESKGSPRNSLVLAATNQPWSVDLALRRSGRFDSAVFIPNPDAKARVKIFELSLKARPVDKSVKLDKLADMTKGYASAEIVEICDRAAKIPLRELLREKKKRRPISTADFNQAIADKRTVLPSWYARALKEIQSSDETDMFLDLIKAAKEYTPSDKRQFE
jgi:transitional endoplasmic reticulum ATPase